MFLKDLEADPVLAKDYADASRGMKAQKRVEHFKNKGEVLKEQINALILLTFSDWNEARWMTPKQLNRALGYDEEATVNWIRSCIELGPSQYKLNVLGYSN